jgi:hypothetical protein
MGDIAEDTVQRMFDELLDDEWVEYRDDGPHVGKYPRCHRCNTVCAWHQQWNRELGKWDFFLVEKHDKRRAHACPTAKPTDFPCLSAS